MGVIINIPNTVLIMDFSIPSSPLLSGAGSLFELRGSRRSRAQRLRWQRGIAGTIAQRVIFRAGSAYT
jgi:hypothetical protein